MAPSVVDLPQPDGPSRGTNSPSATRMLMWSTARTEPNCLCRFSISNSAIKLHSEYRARSRDAYSDHQDLERRQRGHQADFSLRPCLQKRGPDHLAAGREQKDRGGV